MWTGSKSAGPSHITECEYRDNNAKKNIQRANIILLRESERRRECKVYTCLVYLKLILIKSYLTNKKMREHISGSHIQQTSRIIRPHYSSVNDLFHNKFKSCLYSICLCHFLSKHFLIFMSVMYYAQILQEETQTVREHMQRNPERESERECL